MAFSLNVQALSDEPMTQFRHGNRIVFRDDGEYILVWKAILPVYLRSAEYAWEVIQGNLDPIKKPEDQPKYNTGNKNA